MKDYEKRCKELLIKSIKPIPQELNEIDWKVALTNKKERLKKHLSAFANLREGGFLIFGIDDNGVPVGISDENSRKIADLLANMSRTALDPQINIHYYTFKFDGYSLLGIYVEESFEKPVHIRSKGMERSYIRAGGQSRLMSKEEIRRAIMGSRALRFSEITAAFSQKVLKDWTPYFDFSEVYKRMKSVDYTDEEARNEYLASLKLLAKANNVYIPTNLAVMCCAKNFNLLHSYEKLAIRMIEYSGITKVSARRDVTFSSGYSLCLDNIVKTLIGWLPHVETIKGATLRTTSVIPEVAIRELIVNAIIHRDFTMIDTPIMIETFKDRVEITSPGGLLPELSVDRLIDHPSITRNEVFSDFMRKLRFAEERGSGIDKAIIANEAAGLPPILFQNETYYFKVTIFCEKSYKDMDEPEKINAVFQHACLNTVIHRKTTGRTIRERFKVSSRESTAVYKLIEKAVDIGKIKLANPTAPRKDQFYLPYWM